MLIWLLGLQQCFITPLPSTDLAAWCLVHGAGGLASKVFRQAHFAIPAQSVVPTQQCLPACLPACLSGCLAVPWGAVLQSKREMLENMAANKGQIKLRMDQIRKTDMGLAVQSLPEPETWNVQVFRSIDSGGEAGGARGVG